MAQCHISTNSNSALRDQGRPAAECCWKGQQDFHVIDEELLVRILIAGGNKICRLHLHVARKD